MRWLGLYHQEEDLPAGRARAVNVRITGTAMGIAFARKPSNPQLCYFAQQSWVECELNVRTFTGNRGATRVSRLRAVNRLPRWRVFADVCSAEIGAAAAFHEAIEWDDAQPIPIPGLVRVLSSWTWQEGLETRWWLGAVVEARSAAEAAHRAATGVEQRIRNARSVTVGAHEASALSEDSNQNLDADEELDAHAIPRSRSPSIVPVRASAFARRGDRLTIEWISGAAPLAHVTIEASSSFLTIGVFERRPPLTEMGEMLIRKHRHVVVHISEFPAGLPVRDRYSGSCLSEGNAHTETQPIEPIYQ